MAGRKNSDTAFRGKLRECKVSIFLLVLCMFTVLFSCGTAGTGAVPEIPPEEAAGGASEKAEVPYVSGRPHLVVLPFSTGDDPIAEVLSSVIDGNLGLNIRLLGSHELVDKVFPGDEYSEDSVRTFSYDNEIDSTLYGEVTVSDGRYSIFYRIYDAAKDQVVFEGEYTLDSVLLVFDATEDITEEILSHIADRRLAFGSIEIKTDLEEMKNHIVKLNGVPMDISEETIKVVAGPCSLEIFDKNGEGLFKKNITVAGDKPTIVEIPGSIQTYRAPPGWHFIKDGKGRLWTSFQNDGAGNGVGRYSREEDRWIRYTRSNGLDIKTDAVISMVHADDYIWMTYGNTNTSGASGVTRWNPDTGEITHFGPSEGTPNFPRGSVWFGARKSDGTLWFGMGEDLLPVLFNGISWSSFPVEGGRKYPGASWIAFEGDRGYFKTWRGGLHVYDFLQSRWLHTPFGAAGGEESFFARNFWPSDIALLPEGKIVIATTGGSQGSNPDLGEGDGVWYYDGSVWRNITESLPEGTGLVRHAVADDQERVWCFFTGDHTIRIWDGETWEVWAPLGFVPSAENFLQPRYIDGDWIWMIHKNEAGLRLARARYR